MHTVVLLSPQHVLYVGICVRTSTCFICRVEITSTAPAVILSPSTSKDTLCTSAESIKEGFTLNSIPVQHIHLLCERLCMLQTIRNSGSKTKQDSFSLRLMVQLAIPSNWEEVTGYSYTLSFNSKWARHLTQIGQIAKHTYVAGP